MLRERPVQGAIGRREAVQDAGVEALSLGAPNGVRQKAAAGAEILIAAGFGLPVPDRLIFDANGRQFRDVFEADDDVPQVRDRSMAIGKVELLPEFFGRVAVDPAETVLDGIGRAAVARQRVGGFFRRHGGDGDDAARGSLLIHEKITRAAPRARMVFATVARK